MNRKLLNDLKELQDREHSRLMSIVDQLQSQLVRMSVIDEYLYMWIDVNRR